MSQHDLDIANQTASNARADINLALKALGSTSSGTSDPTTTFANMLFYNTSTNLLRLRNEANSGWIDIGYVDQSSGAFRILDDTQVTNTSGTQTGLLGDQSTATWEAGTGTTQSLVSPANVKASVLANSSTAAMYAYDVQEFTTNGTWTKPAGAASGDVVIVWGVGGGGGGARQSDVAEINGGNGGTGFLWRINDITTLAATRSVSIGGGGAGVFSGAGSNGGTTVFGTSNQAGYCQFSGGSGGTAYDVNQPLQTGVQWSVTLGGNVSVQYEGGLGVRYGGGGFSHYGGGGAGQTAGGSAFAGMGGTNFVDGSANNGTFPGGGGGANVNPNSGNGAAGYMQVTSYRST
jgi:hypothetical protein